MSSWADDDGSNDLGVPPPTLPHTSSPVIETAVFTFVAPPVKPPVKTKPKVVRLGVRTTAEVTVTTTVRIITSPAETTMTRCARSSLSDISSSSFPSQSSPPPLWETKVGGAHHHYETSSGAIVSGPSFSRSRRGGGSSSSSQHICMRCAANNAFINVSDEHIEAIKGYVSEGKVDANLAEGLKSGLYCTACLAVISPKCNTCNTRPRNIITSGVSKYLFALFCKECIKAHRATFSRSD